MADHDGHTVNVGPVTIGEPLPVADPIDIDATVVSLLRSYGPNERDINVICNEVDRLRSENEALADAAIGVWLDARLKSAVDTDWIVSGTAMDALRNAIPEVEADRG